MSRPRLKNRLRTNEDFRILKRLADTVGARIEVSIIGRQHPIATVSTEDGCCCEVKLASTPSTVNARAVESRFRKALQDAGVLR